MRIYVKWFCYSKLLLSTIWGYFEISLVLPVPVLLIVITNYFHLILKYLSYINDCLFFWDSTLQDTHYISGIVRDNSIDSIRRQLKFNSNWFKDPIFLSESDSSRPIGYTYIICLKIIRQLAFFRFYCHLQQFPDRINAAHLSKSQHATLNWFTAAFTAIFLHIDIGNRIFFV